MKKAKEPSRKQVEAGLRELDALSRDEYGLTLEQLLLDPDPVSALRLQRLTGIALKRPFAKAVPARAEGETRAKRAWPWKQVSPDSSPAKAQEELRILNQLRMPGPWNERKPLTGTPEDRVPISWDEFEDDADHERGLFKILALYVADVLERREHKSIRKYLESDESRRFEAGLDLATLVFDAAVTGPVSSLIGVPAVAVGLVLVGLQYGYRRLTDGDVGRRGDSHS